MGQAGGEEVYGTMDVAVAHSTIEVPVCRGGLTLQSQEAQSGYEPCAAQDKDDLYRDAGMGVFEETPVECQDGELCSSNGKGVKEAAKKHEHV